MPWFFRDVDTLHGLDDEQVERVSSLLQKRSYTPGELIVDADTPPDWFYLIREGRVRLFLQAGGNREITVDYVERGGLFGVSGMFGPGLDGLRAEAVTRVLASVGDDEGMHRLAEMPEVMLNLVQQLGTRIQHVERQLERVGSSTARERLASELFVLARDTGEDLPAGGRCITARVTHTTLARQIGASRETVTRLLGDLEAAGLIRRQGRRLIVPDLATLAQSLPDAGGWASPG